MKIKRMDAGRGQSRRVLYDLVEGEAIVARFSSLEEAALAALKAIDERGGAYNG